MVLGPISQATALARKKTKELLGEKRWLQSRDVERASPQAVMRYDAVRGAPRTSKTKEGPSTPA